MTLCYGRDTARTDHVPVLPRRLVERDPAAPKADHRQNRYPLVLACEHHRNLIRHRCPKTMAPLNLCIRRRLLAGPG